MANLKNELKDRQAITKEIQRLQQVMKSHNETAKSYQQAQEKILKLEKELNAIRKQDDNFLKLQKEITKQKKEQAAIGKKSASLERQLNKLKDSGVGTILKEVGLTKSLDKTVAASKKTSGEAQKAFNLASEVQLAAIEDIKNGTFDATEFMANFEEQLEGLGPAAVAAATTAKKELEDFARIAKEGGEALSDSLNIDAKDLDGLEDARSSMKKFSAIVSSPKLMGAAAIGYAVKLMMDFAENAKQIRQDLGLTVGQAAAVGGKITVAQKAMKVMGGDSSQVAGFVTGISQEFGNISEFSTITALQFAKISSTTGLAGESAAKLAKSIQVIQGGSLDTSLNMIETYENMARTAGVSAKLVLEDIAQDTETFAKFAKDGGKNIAAAAIQARKLGLNLGTVAGIAESLLDFESSIEKSMEASMLLGRQVNTDKARELALMGDLEGLAKEVKNQVGTQAEFEAMNVIQRQKLAEAMGVTVSDLGKIVAGEKTSAQVAEEAAKKKEESLSRQQGLEMALAGATASAAVAQAAASVFGIFGSFAKIPFGLGIPLGLAAVASMFTLAKGAKAAVGLEAGGTVKETGMAEVHKGEVFSGTKNEMGFGGNKETIDLLKESLAEAKRLRSENQALMTTLTGKVGEIGLSS